MEVLSVENKDYMKNVYRNFSEFVAITAARELEYFITDAEFTSAFNYRMKRLLDEAEKSGKDELNFSILLNTNGEVALIDSEIIGNFISDNYTVLIEKHYKNRELNKIINEVVNGTEKCRKDFVIVSYSILYDVLNKLYKELKCKKELYHNIEARFEMKDYKGEDSLMIAAVYLILEDICKYIGIQKNKVIEYTKYLHSAKSK
jgi:hypothetical protein